MATCLLPFSGQNQAARVCKVAGYGSRRQVSMNTNNEENKFTDQSDVIEITFEGPFYWVSERERGREVSR